MTSKLFDSFEAFDASIMDVVNIGTPSHIIECSEDATDKENIQNKSRLKICDFAHISFLGEESIHVDQEEVEEKESKSSTDYDNSSKAKNFARLMNVLKSVHPTESLGENSKKERKRRQSPSPSCSASTSKRPKILDKRENKTEKIREKATKTSKTAEETNLSTKNNSPETKSGSAQKDKRADGKKRKTTQNTEEKEIYLYIPKSFYLKKKESVTIEIPIEKLDDNSRDVDVRLHLSHRYDTKYSHTQRHDQWALQYDTKQTTENGRIKCKFTNLTQTEVKVPRNMKIGRANFTLQTTTKQITQKQESKIAEVALNNDNAITKIAEEKVLTKDSPLQSKTDNLDEKSFVANKEINKLDESLHTQKCQTKDKNVLETTTQKTDQSNFNPNLFSSLKMLPQFTKFAQMYCKFKSIASEQGELALSRVLAHRCDDCIIDCETIGLTNSDELFNIMKANWDEDLTDADWISLLSEKYSLIGSGLVENIQDIVQTYRAWVAEVVNKERLCMEEESFTAKHRNEEVIKQVAQSHSFQETVQERKDVADPEQMIETDEQHVTILNVNTKQREKHDVSENDIDIDKENYREIKGKETTEDIRLEREVNHYKDTADNSDIWEKLDQTELSVIEKEATSGKDEKRATNKKTGSNRLDNVDHYDENIEESDTTTERTNNESKPLSNSNTKESLPAADVPKLNRYPGKEMENHDESVEDISENKSDKRFHVEEEEMSVKHKYLEEDINKQAIEDMINNKEVESEPTFDKWKQEKSCIIHGTGTIIEHHTSGLGLIKCDDELIIFGTDTDDFTVDSHVYFDAIEGPEEEFEGLFGSPKKIKFWVTNMWTLQKPEKRVLNDPIEIEKEFLNILSYIIEFKMYWESTDNQVDNELDSVDLDASYRTEKNSDCPHFPDPGPFCSNVKYCQRNCGLSHEISEKLETLLGREIGSYCSNFAQYQCKLGNKCLKTHKTFTELAEIAQRGMERRRNHCHKCNEKKQSGTPCNLLDQSQRESYGLCKFKATQAAGCGKQSCKFSHRVPRHMDLDFCWLFMRGECNKPNCSHLHLQYVQVNHQFKQILNSLTKNCKKCEKDRESSVSALSERSYSRMSITFDNFPEESYDSDEETRREVEFSTAEKRGLRIKMSNSKFPERGQTRTDSQDSYTRDVLELGEKIRDKKNRENSPEGGISRQGYYRRESSPTKDYWYSSSPEWVSYERRPRERRSESPPNRRYVLEERRTPSRSPPEQKYRRYKGGHHSRSRSPVSNHRGYSKERKRKSHEYEERVYIRETISRSPSVDYNHETIQDESYERKYSRSRSPTSEERYETEMNTRRVTIQEDRSSRRGEQNICTHYLKGKCLYGEKCFKTHLEPGERTQKTRDLRQRLIRKV